MGHWNSTKAILRSISATYSKETSLPGHYTRPRCPQPQPAVAQLRDAAQQLEMDD